jgi:UDP-GlcNAc:undecaprenyl-phosphate GlcNAc-1-phosphate transferase
MWPVWYLVVAIAALGVARLLTPAACRLGLRLGIADAPGGRRLHQGLVPRLGGVPLFAGFAAGIGIAASAGVLTLGYNPEDHTRLLGLIAGVCVAFAAGLADDRLELTPALQLTIQVMLSLTAVATSVVLERFTLPIVGYVELHATQWGLWASIPLTVLWVAGMMNTVNWLDGIDGLAGGVGAVLCCVLAVHMHRVGQPSVAVLPVALLGALLGMLPFNFAPAQIFLGSAGTYVLGYALACLGLIAGGRVATVLLVMGLPIVDVGWQILDRLRHHRSPATADRGHLHFRLLDRGVSARNIVLAYWGFCAVFGVLALTVSSQVFKLVALLGIGVVAGTVLVSLSRGDRADK